MTAFVARTITVYRYASRLDVFWITLPPAGSAGVDRRLEKQLVDVTPAPILAGLEAAHYGMARGMEVLGGMPPGRVIAAPDVAALLAHAKVNPAAAGGQAFLASFGGSRLDRADIGEMGASLRHERLLR
jgi:hypothetical protein